MHNKAFPGSAHLIQPHLDKFFNDGEVKVLHEKESDIVHTDVFVVKPHATRNYNLLLTCGLSALPMKVPPGMENFKFAEVSMLLPLSWDLNFENLKDENNYWPIRALIRLSKYPHLNDTWFGFGHTVSLDLSHKVNHNFTSIILLGSINLPESFTHFSNRDKQVHIYSAIPIYKEELDFTMRYGSERLLEKFENFDIDEIVDIQRKNVCL